MKEKFLKLTSNLGFIISVTTLILLLIDNREEIKNCAKEIVKKESWVKFKDDVKSTFSSYTSKASRIYKQAVEIIGE